MSTTTTKSNQGSTKASMETIDFPNQLSQIMANHADEVEDPMVLGCSDLTAMNTTIPRSPDDEPATKSLDNQTSGAASSHQFLEDDDFVHISVAEVKDYAYQTPTGPGWKPKDVLENLKLMVWVAAWTCMKR